MGYIFGTDEWAKALQQHINESSEYKNAAAKWGLDFNGNVLLSFQQDERLPQSLNLLLRLKGGECSGVEFVEGPSHPDAAFVLKGPFSLWQEILMRKTMAATAILTGKLEVEGDKMTLLKHTGANRALVHCTASVDTDFE